MKGSAGKKKRSKFAFTLKIQQKKKKLHEKVLENKQKKREFYELQKLRSNKF